MADKPKAWRGVKQKRPEVDGRAAPKPGKVGRPRGPLSPRDVPVVARAGQRGFNPVAAPCRLCPLEAVRKGLCAEHYAAAHKARYGGKNRPLTDDDKAEIRRRSSRFESNMTIAKAMGISRNLVYEVLHPNRRKASE